MAENPNQPVYILPEGATRDYGKTAQKNNILAAKLVAETVRTTLGPKGMDKMLVDSLGDVITTNDGVTILEEMSIEHPVGKMIVEIAKTQENEVGDGTTTAVVLAGEFMKEAEELLDNKIHPTVIIKGYRLAAEKAKQILEQISIDIGNKDGPLLKKIGMTAMTGKGAENAKEQLSELAVRAIKAIIDEDKNIDIENIKLEKKVGDAVSDSQLINGIILDKEKVHAQMPRVVTNGKIALLDSALEIKNTEIDAKIQITDPEKLQQFLDMEEDMIRKMIDKVVYVGAKVVFCQKGIDDLAQHYLAKHGIYACRRVKKSDMEKLARATGANIVTNIENLGKDDLGSGNVEEKKVGDEAMTFITDCKKAKSVTLLIRGGTEHVIDEVKRAMEDAIGDIASAVKGRKVVSGAGAVETILALKLKNYANTLSGREQLAVQAYANAIEIIPKTIAENAGLDPIDIVTSMKSALGKKFDWPGINVFTGKVMDAWKEGIIEPLKIKTQALSAATEVAVMILRIDDVIATGKGNDVPQSPGME